jgi:hypothetical protein
MRARTRHRSLERRAFGLSDDYRHQLSPPVHSHRVSRAGAQTRSISSDWPRRYSSGRFQPISLVFVAHQIARNMKI